MSHKRRMNPQCGDTEQPPDKEDVFTSKRPTAVAPMTWNSSAGRPVINGERDRSGSGEAAAGSGGIGVFRNRSRGAYRLLEAPRRVLLDVYYGGAEGILDGGNMAGGGNSCGDQQLDGESSRTL